MRILIIEDDQSIRTALGLLLQLEGHEPVSVAKGEEALDHLATREDIDVILLDLTTEGISAQEFMERFDGLCAERANKHRPKVGVVSASHSIDFEARRIQADFVVRKPFDHEALLSQLSRAQGQGKLVS